MEKLTQREEFVMQLLWRLKEAVVKDLIAEYPDPKPPYTTVSSIIRILEDKGYVGHKAYGKTHVYHPLVSKRAFRKHSFSQLVQEYFGGSYEQVVSFMVEEENLPESEIEKIREIISEAEKKEGGQNG
ncbi:MAG: BlaI/MecI/CopY family transcriptional regulator [Bacteroidia bacterium]|nr:BlaI/MecI/CopY family transcriptional regulator [Bacteroidia bacterium]